jgi:hypothetical protein
MTRAAAQEVPLRIGVALGAGSAAAMAQIGALEVLGDAGIPLHCIAGTSAGALVGAAHAAGRLAEFRETMEGLSRRRVLRLFDLAWPREGLLRGRRALESRAAASRRADRRARVPYAAVATDLLSGHGSRSRAARYSTPCARHRDPQASSRPGVDGRLRGRRARQSGSRPTARALVPSSDRTERPLRAPGTPIGSYTRTCSACTKRTTRRSTTNSA